MVSVVRDNFAVFHVNDALGMLGDVRLVRDEDDGSLPFLMEFLKRAQYRLAGFCVQISRRLVGKDKSRVIYQGPRNRYPLHHATRKLV